MNFSIQHLILVKWLCKLIIEMACGYSKGLLIGGYGEPLIFLDIMIKQNNQFLQAELTQQTFPDFTLWLPDWLTQTVEGYNLVCIAFWLVSIAYHAKLHIVSASLKPSQEGHESKAESKLAWSLRWTKIKLVIKGFNAEAWPCSLSPYDREPPVYLCVLLIIMDWW